MFWPERIGSVYQSILNPNHTAVLVMAQQIQSLAVSFVNTAWWLDTISKKHAIAKIKAITFHIGYGKTLSGDCTNNISIVTDYITCSMKTFSANVNALTSTPNPENDWEMSAIEVNAYYTPLFNAIYIPYGIAQMPLYDLELHPLFNMAGLGAIIAHEIGHSIDPSGVHFDNRGNRVPWLSQTSKNSMETLEKCIETHYATIGVDNAERTLNENFADLFSLSVLQGTNDFNPIRNTYLNVDSETFWISWAQTWCRTSIHLNPGPIPKNTDVHAQARYRVLGMSTQSTLLKETFHCKKIETPICMVEDQS
jgi:predicted metalloendopeptidase